MQTRRLQPVGPINQQIDTQALNETLSQHCLEDCTQHGRLLALREILTNLNGGQRLTSQQLACLYAKDVSVCRGFSKIIPDGLAQLLNNVPDF